MKLKLKVQFEFCILLAYYRAEILCLPARNGRLCVP